MRASSPGEPAHAGDPALSARTPRIGSGSAGPTVARQRYAGGAGTRKSLAANVLTGAAHSSPGRRRAFPTSRAGFARPPCSAAPRTAASPGEPFPPYLLKPAGTGVVPVAPCGCRPFTARFGTWCERACAFRAPARNSAVPLIRARAPATVLRASSRVCLVRRRGRCRRPVPASPFLLRHGIDDGGGGATHALPVLDPAVTPGAPGGVTAGAAARSGPHHPRGAR